MQAKDLMTQPVVFVSPSASIFGAAQLMLRHKISGLPVVGSSGSLTGILTEGDFLRRSETHSAVARGGSIFSLARGKLAEEYTHASGRRVDEIMTEQVHTVQEEARLDEIVRVTEHYRVKRVPVVRGEAVRGIITRADLMRALARQAPATVPKPTTTPRSMSNCWRICMNRNGHP